MMRLANRTWREMDAQRIDLDKVVKVVRKQLELALLRGKPSCSLPCGTREPSAMPGG